MNPFENLPEFSSDKDFDDYLLAAQKALDMQKRLRCASALAAWFSEFPVCDVCFIDRNREDSRFELFATVGGVQDRFERFLNTLCFKTQNPEYRRAQCALNEVQMLWNCHALAWESTCFGKFRLLRSVSVPSGSGASDILAMAGDSAGAAGAQRCEIAGLCPAAGGPLPGCAERL